MKSKKGFTLVELLAVIVILGIVILVAITSIGPLMARAKKSALGDEGISLINSVTSAQKFDNYFTQFDKQNVCVTLSYLHEQEYYPKGIDDGYDGSIYISYDSSTGKYDYKFWLTNGVYAYMGVTIDDINVDNAVDYVEGTDMNNCGGFNENYIGTSSEIDSVAPSIKLEPDSNGSTFTQTKIMTISIDENGSGLSNTEYTFRYNITTKNITSCDNSDSWSTFTVRQKYNYKYKITSLSKTRTGKFKFYLCPSETISDKAGNSLTPTLYSSDYYLDNKKPNFIRFDTTNISAVNYDINNNVIETVSSIKSFTCDDATAHCDIYMCTDFRKISGDFQSSIAGFKIVASDTSKWHSVNPQFTYVNKNNQAITKCVGNVDTPCVYAYTYDVCDEAGNCTNNMYSISIYQESSTAGYCV